MPGPGHFQGVFEFRAKAAHVRTARPVRTASAALIAIAAEKILMFGFHVAKARDVDAVGAIAEGHLVFVAGHSPAGAAAHVVIHEVVAEFAAAVGEATREFGSSGIEENTRGLERGSENEKDPGLEFQRVFGLAIDHPDTAHAAG